MNEFIVSEYKKLIGSVISINHSLFLPNGEKFIEIIQGVLREAKDNSITIEQYASIEEYFNGVDVSSRLRKFEIGTFHDFSLEK